MLPLAVSVLLGGLGWVAALAVLLAFSGKSEFVSFHAKQELILHLANFVLIVVAVVLAFTVILIPVALLLGLFSLVLMVVLPIVAAVQASNGAWYRMPIVGSFVDRP